MRVALLADYVAHFGLWTYRCFAHILNLAVQAILRHIGAPLEELELAEEYDEEALDSEEEDVQTVAQAIARQPLTIGRAFFRTLKRSARNVDRLFAAVDQYNDLLGPNAKPASKMDKLKPVLDSKTRWDSTYLLVERLLHYKKASRSCIGAFVNYTNAVATGSALFL